MRRIPSRCANWLMAKLSGVDIHDFGTTFKAYRREVIQQHSAVRRDAPVYSRAGFLVWREHLRNSDQECESRTGKIHYGISRTFRVFFDLMTIRFLLKYMSVRCTSLARSAR